MTTRVLRMAGLDKEKNGDLPWYVRLLERHGISTVLVLVGLWFVYVHGGSWVQAYIQNQQAERAEMSVFLKAQVEVTRALLDEAKVERQFETEVKDVHLQQTEALTSVLLELKQANEMMAPVPDLRREELTILREIRDKDDS